MTSADPSRGRIADAAEASSQWLARNRFLLAIAFCLALIFLLPPAPWKLPLLEPDEGRNAEVAREMLRGGDWITPHYNGYPYLDKPAPFFWLVATSFKAFGVSEWSARFPSALAALGTLLLIGILAREMFGPDEAILSAVVLVTSPLFLILSRIVIFDMTLTFLITAALVFFWRDESKPRRTLLNDLGLFAAMGLATITKGPVGFLLPLLGILVYSLLRGGISRFKRIHWGPGFLAFLAVGLPWFIAVSVQNPDFPRYAFWQESLVRFTTGSSHRSGGILYYLPVYLGGFFPWSLPLLIAAFARVKRWKVLRDEENASLALLVSFVAVVFVFFSISRSKLPGYFLPAVGPLSILMARLWTHVRSQAAGRTPDWLKAAFAILVVVGLLLLIAPRLDYFQTIHARLARKLPSNLISLMKGSLVFSGVLLAALGILGRDFSARARRVTPPAVAFVVLLLTTPLVFLQWRSFLDAYAKIFSSRAIASTILASPERDVPVYGFYYFRTGLPFYLRHPIGIVTSGGEEMTSNYVASGWPNLKPDLPAAGFEQDQPWGTPELPGPLVVEKDWRNRSGKDASLVVVRNRLVPEMFKVLGSADPLWTEWDFSVWKNAPPKPPPATQDKVK